MKTFWLFRSNLTNLEYYHSYTNLEDFEKNCHDFYMLFPLWLLRNNYVDQVVVWRLTKKPRQNIDFNVDGKLYSQRWVTHLRKVYKQQKATYSLFRGGFPEYDQVVNGRPDHFGLKLYLGTGKRTYPQYGGKYDIYLQEDQRDNKSGYSCLPFYKTASPHIFHPIENSKIKYDICWPANFTQHRYKGQAFFITEIAKNPYLKGLKIVHLGNDPKLGRQMCIKNGINKI